MKIASSKDLIVLLLYAKGAEEKICEPIVGRTRLIKMIFLFDKEIRPKFNLKKEIPDSALPSFEPYNFGPFSDQIYADLEFLVNFGMVKVKRVGADDDVGAEAELTENEYWQLKTGNENATSSYGEMEEFFLTQDGREFVKTGAIGKMTSDQWEIFDKFKKRCTEIPLAALLKYVYDKYPEMATKSLIRDKLNCNPTQKKQGS